MFTKKSIKITYANRMASKASGILEMAELKIASRNAQLCMASLYHSDEIRSEEPFGPINIKKHAIPP